MSIVLCQSANGLIRKRLPLLLVVALLFIFIDSAALQQENRTLQVFVSVWRKSTEGSASPIYRLDPVAQSAWPIATNFERLSLGTCGPDGFLYFAERGKSRIIKVDPATGVLVSEVVRFQGEQSPEGPIFDDNGNLYFTNTEIGGVWMLLGANAMATPIQIVQNFGIVGDNFVAGSGVAFLKQPPYSGDLIVSHFEKNVVYRISASDFCSRQSGSGCGKPKVFLEENVNQPTGIAVNNHGDIFVATFEYRTNSGQILQFSPQGEFMGSIARASGGISGIAFDKDDNLWAVSTNSVFKITPEGERTLVTSVPPFGMGIAICE